MNKIISTDILNGIHHLLKINNIKFDDELIEKADSEIIKYIEENVELEEEKYKIAHYGGAVFLKDSHCAEIFVRYIAITQDSVSLLEKLNKIDYKFNNGHNYNNIFVFDKRLSSRFSEDKYVMLLEENTDVFRKFHHSLRFIPEEEINSVVDDFVEIIKKAPRILKYHDAEDNYDRHNNLLTAKNIQIYGKDFLINSNNNQRRIINSINESLSDAQLNKLKYILINYPDFVPKIELSSKLFNMFDIYEIIGMSEKDARLYTVAFERGLETRIRRILLLDENFDCSDKFIQEEIFRVLDDETIISLTDEAKWEISEMKIPKMNNVLIMPIKNINKIVAKDKKRREKMGIEEKPKVM